MQISFSLRLIVVSFAMLTKKCYLSSICSNSLFAPEPWSLNNVVRELKREECCFCKMKSVIYLPGLLFLCTLEEHYTPTLNLFFHSYSDLS